VLITELEAEVVKEMLTDGEVEREDGVVGEMWELARREGGGNEIDVTRPFKVADIRGDWALFSAEPLGMTTLSEGEVEREGIVGIARETEFSSTDNEST
jgi:hypothetical protein